ncbi:MULTISPECIES: excisionase family DNA-binding protein [unclassified Brevibacterium]|uniref:excisionase family DNA-binding protein n=1 Tax=unclassified Brevibacterium TaxID=2614124 RepID=UPI001092DC50|nr:excisionase family DNA-binding protein [Brevibacterium sp. S22]TGD30870.1 helix-turn-helix domain-containing protein [Brevibacterium sp. S22]
MIESDAVAVSAEDSAEDGKLAAVVDFIAHKQRREDGVSGRYYLSGADGTDRVELTEELFDVLKRAAEGLRKGQSVSLLRRDQEITTQQAADLLGLSRPTIVKLIDAGELEANVPGSVRRKLRLADVVAYRDQLHIERSDFISESSYEYQNVDEGESAEALSEIRQERRNHLS